MLLGRETFLPLSNPGIDGFGGVKYDIGALDGNRFALETRIGIPVRFILPAWRVNEVPVHPVDLDTFVGAREVATLVRAANVSGLVPRTHRCWRRRDRTCYMFLRILLAGCCLCLRMGIGREVMRIVVACPVLCWIHKERYRRSRKCAKLQVT